MNKKIFALAIATISMLLITPIAHAQVPPDVTVWTDSQKYSPGQTGTLYIAFYNTRDVAVTIYNVTTTYSNWKAYIGGAWVGNQTYTMSVPLAGKATERLNDVVAITFTVPTDGRAVSTDVSVEIGTDHGYSYGSGYVNVPETPSYMDQIVTLFTIQVVLLIVCTIIIAATIFLSAHRPQVTWKTEEKG
jgi:hypothetical protein